MLTDVIEETIDHSRLVPAFDSAFPALLEIPAQLSLPHEQLFKRHELLDPRCTMGLDECGNVVRLGLRRG